MNKVNTLISLSIFAAFLLLIPLAAASDFAYVLKNSLGIDPYLTQEIQNNGYTFDIIYEPNVQSTDFSAYRLIIVGNQDFSNVTAIPVESHKALIINSYNYYKSGSDYQLGWSTGVGATSSPTTMNVIDSGSSIVSGLPSTFYAYNGTHSGVTTSFLGSQKPTGINKILISSGNPVNVVLATMDPGSQFLNGKTATERNLFFGATKAQYWTTSTKTLFTNSLTWLLDGEDRDGDGFASGIDCNDLNPSIYPGADEIPYDFIDQSCDGADLADVDGDGYCQAGYSIGNKALQCNNEQDSVGTDCDDSSSEINPGSSNLALNCINDAPIVSDISDQIVNEGDLVVISVEASDPEGDSLTYSINDPRFDKDESLFFSQTGYSDSGVYEPTITVSDGQNQVNKSFSLTILNVNQPPTSEDIPTIILDEDSSSLLNLSEYFSDSDNDVLIFGIDSSSNEPRLSVYQNGEIFNFTSTENWNGNDWVVFSATDGEYQVLSNIVNIVVNPVNDAPTFSGDIENQSMNENTNLDNAFDLNDYFSDIDSSLDYSVSGNENISVSIEDGIVSFSPSTNWYGDETVIFSATDGEYNVSSNILTLNVIKAREAPVFSNLSCETNITEDTQYSCTLEATDFENDELTFIVGNPENMNCEVSGNVLTYSPVPDFNGNASCDLVVFDIDGSDSTTLNVFVNPVNDIPSFSGAIENQTFSQNTDLQYVFDLNDYFSDIDSSLDYSVSGNENISVSIEDGIVSFSPDTDWYGQENIRFEASDGEFTVFSNLVNIKVLYVGKPPVFSNLSCETNITEDTQYSCTLEATDFENDSIAFSVDDNSNMLCYLIGNDLIYSGKLNYDGNASCTILASDIDGESSLTLDFYVNSVNDAPTITSRSPGTQSISVLEGKSQTFTITASDPENDPINYSWFINNEKTTITSRSLALSDLEAGLYNVTVSVSDSQLQTSYSWSLVVGSISQYTCSQVSGHLCTEKQTCASSFLGVYDTQRCCPTTCIPLFKDASRCSAINSSIEISIDSPNEDEEFTIGDSIDVDVKVENNLQKDQNLDVSAELYDVTDDSSIVDGSADLDLAEGDSDTVTVNLEVPAMDKIHDYVIFVRAKDDVCNQAYIPITITRPEHKLQIEKVDSFEEAVCGDTLDFKVKIVNIGDNDESTYVEIRNSDLNIDQTSDEFDLESSGNDDSTTKTFEVTIPDDAEAGTYDIDFSAISDDADTTFTKTITLGECSGQSVTKQSTPTRIELNSLAANSEEPKSDNSVFIVGIIVFVMILASISIVSFALFKKKNRANKNNLKN